MCINFEEEKKNVCRRINIFMEKKIQFSLRLLTARMAFSLESAMRATGAYFLCYCHHHHHHHSADLTTK